MRALDRKLLRDLSHMRGQVITIALVVACGIASYVAIKGTHASLLGARDAYYERQHFADVFAHAKSAPESLRTRLEQLPGVAAVVTRLVEPVSFPIDETRAPATGQLVSLPARGAPALGGITLRAGRLFEPGRSDEVVVLEAFAKAHGLGIGDRLPVVLAGVRRELRITGVALSPEYVFSISPGEMVPDPRRFGVIWMDRDVIASAFDRGGAFDSLLVRLQPNASQVAVIHALDRMLEPYGGYGAHGRDRQLSHSVVMSELAQLTMLTRMMPSIFLGVAAFLINVVLARLVQLQRAQIAVLKAIGYRRLRISLHYLELMSVIVLGGSILGIGFGIYTGRKLTALYTKFFTFPDLGFDTNPRVLITGIAISLLAALVGALAAALRVMRLPPAEAMRPEAPPIYVRGKRGLGRASWLVGTSARMVLREVRRRPLRALLSVLGIAMGVAVLVAGRFGRDAVDWYMHVQFEIAQREDVAVSFRRPVPLAALAELRSFPGVLSVEGQRILPVRYRAGARSRVNLLFGHAAVPRLRHILDTHGNVSRAPERGIVVASALGKLLGLRLGDDLVLDVLEGERRSYRVPIAGFVDEVFGLFGHMRSDRLAELLDDEAPISRALLRIDPQRYPQLLRALTARPEVLGVTRTSDAIDAFRAQTGGQMLFTTLIMTVFGAIIASGVVYNNARIALAMRTRDLASMRVLGFRRGEVSAILIGELMLHVAVALLPGMLIGKGIAQIMMRTADDELYRFPAMISPQTYAFAALVTVGASLVSAFLVRQRIDRLDLIGVLKSRE
jgi:putative ABC transport system permease protein